MLYTDIKQITSIISEDEKRVLQKELVDSFPEEITESCSLKVDELLFLFNALSVKAKLLNHKKIIAYGAGNVTKRYLAEIQKYIRFDEVWDKYSEQTRICNLPIVHPNEDDSDIGIIIMLDNEKTRIEVQEYLASIGIDDVFFYREVFDERVDFSPLESISIGISAKGESLLEKLQSKYELLDTNQPEVLFSLLDSGLKLESTYSIDLSNDELKRLYHNAIDLLNVNCTKVELCVNRYFKEKQNGIYEILKRTELFLRDLLADGAKTKYRPIRMKGDYPYDGIAVTEMLILLLNSICKDDTAAILSILDYLQKLSAKRIWLSSVKCHFLCMAGKCEEALQLARETLHDGSDDFIANESFYHVAKACKENGILVDEPICELDLNEYFCWCGMNYAWCGGYDYERNDAAFSPCFRPSCVAAPRGDFFTGEEWIEFRKSLIDGTFRYCQKSQCPNLLSGWLPKKEKCQDKTVKEIIESDIKTIPNLDEIHLSYDSHCNLRCPSCRTEFCTNSKEQNESLDRFYEAHLKKYVKKAKHLCLQGCGEAMLSPHSRKILQSLADSTYDDLKVELRTNVTSITRKNWESLGEGRFRIKHIAASIDAATKNSFEKIRFPAKWDVVYQNLEYIRDLRKSGEIELFEFHVVVQRDNLEELVDIVKLAASLNADVVTFSRLVNWMGKTKDEYLNINPYWIESDLHDRLNEVVDEIKDIRAKIESGECEWMPKEQKICINLPSVKDYNDRYDFIRYGRLKIR